MIAVNNFEQFPVDVNRASERELLRVPGVGPLAANRIVKQRTQHTVTQRQELQAMGVVLKRAMPFLRFPGHKPVPAKQGELSLFPEPEQDPRAAGRVGRWSCTLRTRRQVARRVRSTPGPAGWRHRLHRLERGFTPLCGGASIRAERTRTDQEKMLRIGSHAPDFTVPLSTGDPFTLSEQRGRNVVLFFFPRAGTQGVNLGGRGVPRRA